MRIIDKNTDFYDYCQNMCRDNSLTFDRTDSFILSKDDLCGNLYVNKYTKEEDFESTLITTGFLLNCITKPLLNLELNRDSLNHTFYCLLSLDRFTKPVDS